MDDLKYIALREGQNDFVVTFVFYIILQYCSAKFVYVTLTPLATIAFTILTAFVAIYLPAINPASQVTQHLIKKHVSFNKPEKISQLKFCKAITLILAVSSHMWTDKLNRKMISSKSIRTC